MKTTEDEAHRVKAGNATTKELLRGLNDGEVGYKVWKEEDEREKCAFFYIHYGRKK